ncbi:Sel1 repeat-containing protein [Pseudogulbenkiania sp. NH8B]|uniref:tetratricopeptide repeat protein n=1 Tax=Pseudogulbenkiania sp. (strain NH8B) TaxID=748280 RepID=UPI0002279B8F|nr:tetratricopeptide repeat protein [Pseudogulbenkiania sp. NH8B]BAK75884.1 Sel1 repeat-containing protein [Pseudogulbenkiania sp. NH8B]
MLSRKIPSRLLRLANDADADSQFEVAEFLRQDDNPDFRMIAYWYRRAAEQGHCEAQNNLGTLYQRGLGVAQDDTEAVLWYRLAAEQGEPIAQYNLATRYRLGEGVPLDLDEAVKWLKRSAGQDYPGAVADLGVAYWLGHGVAKDVIRAAALFDSAAEYVPGHHAGFSLSRHDDRVQLTARPNT